MVDADFFRGGRREVDDAALDIGPSVADGYHRAPAGFEIGDLRGSSQRQSLARGIVALRLHDRTVGHFPAGEFLRIERRLTETFVAGEVQRGIRHDGFMHGRGMHGRGMRGCSGMRCSRIGGGIRLVRPRGQAPGRQNTGKA